MKTGEKRSRDDKPRLREKPDGSASRRQNSRARLKMLQTIGDPARLAVVDRAPSGGKSGVVLGVTGPQGGISSRGPAHGVALKIRRALDPRTSLIRVAPCAVLDAAGRRVATIVTDPVTGKRSRVAP